jgi:hypothetical protein
LDLAAELFLELVSLLIDLLVEGRAPHPNIEAELTLG